MSTARVLFWLLLGTLIGGTIRECRGAEVYKCGPMVYQDAPCQGGKVIELRENTLAVVPVYPSFFSPHEYGYAQSPEVFNRLVLAGAIHSSVAYGYGVRSGGRDWAYSQPRRFPLYGEMVGYPGTQLVPYRGTSSFHSFSGRWQGAPRSPVEFHNHHP
jgi:hypothetical protein